MSTSAAAATAVVASPMVSVPIPTPGVPRVYNAIYSSVQVYECMVRGIAVMRRRLDSYVNATQILKVAGIDKGRRTKILEKEILPGRHEIVQGGYGKYQGTWIPLERGREVATQFGVLPILAPLFDYVPPTNSLGHLPSLRPGQALFAYPPGTTFPTYSLGAGQPLQIAYPPAPGTALNVLQSGRSAGIFTPTTTLGLPPGFHFTGVGYSIPQTLSAQSSQSSVVSAPIPKVVPPNTTNKDAAANRSASISARPSPAPSSSSLAQATATHTGQKRSRQESAAIGPSSSSATIIEPKAKKSAGSRATRAAAADEARTTKRPRLEATESMDMIIEATQPESEILSPPQSQTTVVNGTPSLLPPPPSLPYIPPNSILPPPLSSSALKPSITDIPNATARFSSKPPELGRPDRHVPLKSAHCRAVLLAIHADEDPTAVVTQLTAISTAGSPVDVDAVIDDQGHTALHWAVSLSRLKVAELLLAHGADVHRGNFAGETALIRAVLSTAPHEANSFGEILTLLLPSLRTVDNNAQSILHHVAHVAGVKGRAAAARYFMETVLERVVRQRDELGGTAELIDLQDVHGDTALNISARVGNRALVRMLIEIGANRILGNKLGLRPGDFGVEGETLKVAYAEDYLGALRKGPSPPVQKSQDVIADLTTMIENLSAEFTSEIKIKQDALDTTQNTLRTATRELADTRRQIQQCQASLSDLDQVQQRIRNIEKVLREEEVFDWTGRGEPPAGKRGSTAKTASPTPMLEFDYDADPPFPPGEALGASQAEVVASLVRLKRMDTWHARMEGVMAKRIESIKGASADKEQQCRRVVALCTGVPIEQVDAMLENLVIAIESDGQVVDLGRVAGFMQKVGTTNEQEQQLRQGSGLASIKE